ncbi:hypothetical protein MSAN_01703600 [Mycena sanguinolenta]|uniref:Uncharacterized protein n=1 Tax=Mycena sanguinolenta TaxID=230812 RepID=A0A8H7CTG4_9AGAR|nr:hypothetical protein MSAN_01703600 [Mycena sanguinolenta]
MFRPRSHTMWHSQLHCLFSQLQTASNHEDFVLVESVTFALRISACERNPPDGYLFLCSPGNFQSGKTSFRWPACPAYWSLDSCGKDRLSTEDASSLGFPSLTLKTRVHGNFWDEAAYAALRKIHEVKGIDPECQDPARELGYSLRGSSVPSPEEDGTRHATSDDERSQDFSENDPPESREEFSSVDIGPRWLYSLGQFAELVKFGIIVALASVPAYERAQKEF